MADLNFATLYRPRCFGDVCGQDLAKGVLRKVALADGIVCKSIIMKGAYGCGKTTLCRIFAAAMNDPNFRKVGDVNPEVYDEITSETSQLYIEYDASLFLKMEDFDRMRSRLSLIPTSGRRVVVFDEVHAASLEVKNALLKYLEEGVPNTIFMFATTESILPTIESRSICLDITTVPSSIMKTRLLSVCELAGVSIGDEDLEQVCIKSGGHMRNALSVLQTYSLLGSEALQTCYPLVARFFARCCQKDKAGADAVLVEVLSYPIIDIKRSLYRFIHSCLCAVNGDKLFVFKGVIDTIYAYFFAPHNQCALRDEVGLELCFRSFIEKSCRSTSIK